jgi:hypothetical protein
VFISILLSHSFIFGLLQKYHTFSEYLAPLESLWIMPA